MSKLYYNTTNADNTPPPAYQETIDPPFNPDYVPHHSPPHTPDINYQQPQSRDERSQTLYPQIPTSPALPSLSSLPASPALPLLHVHTSQQSPPQQYQQVRYQAIEIPYTPTTNVRHARHQSYDYRRFPLAAIFFLFGWFCPPLWVIGACCCAGSHNEYESFWGKVNFVMAMTLIVSSIIYSIILMTQY